MSQRTGTLVISVIRNNNVPKFTAATYAKSIREDLGQGNGVLKVEATDSDREVGQIVSLNSWVV